MYEPQIGSYLHIEQYLTCMSPGSTTPTRIMEPEQLDESWCERRENMDGRERVARSLQRQAVLANCPRFTKPALAESPYHVLRPRSCDVCSSRENLTPCKNCLVTYYCSACILDNAPDLERHTKKCRYMGGTDWLLQVPTTDLWTIQEQNHHTLFKVDIMLHLFPNTAAAEMSQRFLLRVHRRGSHRHIQWGFKPWQGLYVAIADLIPVIDVRRGRDEEAYRFIYQVTQSSAPWLDIARRKFGYHRDFTSDEAHAIMNRHRSFEVIQKHSSLGHQVVLTLLAIKALRMVQDLPNISMSGLLGICVGGRSIPQEIMDNIYKYLGTDFLADLFGINPRTAASDATWTRNKIWEMQWVVTKCVYETARSNKHIWRLMLDTDRLEARGEFGQFSTEAGWDVEKMAEVVAVRQYQVWMETPRSFGILRRAMAAAARWASAKEEICWPIERLRDPGDTRPSSPPPRKKRRTQDAWVRMSIEAMPEVYHYHQLSRADSGYKSGFE